MQFSVDPFIRCACVSSNQREKGPRCLTVNYAAAVRQILRPLSSLKTHLPWLCLVSCVCFSKYIYLILLQTGAFNVLMRPDKQITRSWSTTLETAAQGSSEHAGRSWTVLICFSPVAQHTLVVMWSTTIQVLCLQSGV